MSSFVKTITELNIVQDYKFSIYTKVLIYDRTFKSIKGNGKKSTKTIKKEKKMEDEEVATATTENAGEKVVAPVEETKATQPAEKTFTQKEVDEMIKQRLARVEKKQAPVEDEVKALKEQVASYERKLAMKDVNIEDEYRDFVEYKVGKMVTAEKDFSTALGEFVAGEGKKYLHNVDNVKTTPRPENDSGKPYNADKEYVKKKYGIDL